jgi:hypothetical protein
VGFISSVCPKIPSCVSNYTHATYERGQKLIGEGGIRTPETVSRLQHFQCCSFSHSDTSPETGANLNRAGRGNLSAAGNSRRELHRRRLEAEDTDDHDHRHRQ